MVDLVQTLAAAPTPAAIPVGQQEREMRRKLALALIKDGMDTSPVQHWTQGAARMAQTLAGTLEERYLAGQERAETDRLAKVLAGHPALSGGGAAATGASSPAPASNAADAIASIESGGRYDTQGPVITTGDMAGDRAYGKYQVMGANIGPWTKQYLGQEMTPQEFLANPKAQDAVFKGEFGRLSQKHGAEGAARAWFAGEGGMNDLGRKDQLGTTVGSYGQRFVQAGGAGPQVAGQPAPGRTMTPIDAQTKTYINALLASGDRAQVMLGQQLLQQYSKPAELKPMVAGDAVLVIDPATGRLVTQHSVNKPATFGDIGADPVTGQPRKGFIDPNKKTVEPYAVPGEQAKDSKIPPVPPGVDPNVWRETHSKKVAAESLPGTDENAARLRKEVQDLPSYKNLAQAAPVYRSMFDAAGRDTRAADVNLIYGMAKIMDPGSVVRESEMTVAQAIATLPQQLRATVESQLQGTGRLTPEVRAAIMEEANSRIGAYRTMFDQDMGMYRGIATRGRFNEADVIPSFGEFQRYQPPGAPGGAAGADADGWMTVNGVRVRRKTATAPGQPAGGP